MKKIKMMFSYILCLWLSVAFICFSIPTNISAMENNNASIVEEDNNLGVVVDEEDYVQKLTEFGNSGEREIPSSPDKIDSWKIETSAILGEHHGIKVVDIIEDDAKIVFVFESIKVDDLVEGKIYPEYIEYLKKAKVQTRATTRETKYAQITGNFSGTSKVKSQDVLRSVAKDSILAGVVAALGLYTGHPIIAELGVIVTDAIASSIKEGLPNTSRVTADTYRQTRTIARTGYAKNDFGIWQPGIIIEQTEYYSYTSGRVYYQTKPAVPYHTPNKLYKTTQYANYYSSASWYRDQALYYFNRGQIYRNGSIIG